MIFIKYGHNMVFRKIISVSDIFTHYFNDTFMEAKSVSSGEKRGEELQTIILSLFFSLLRIKSLATER